MRWLYKEKKIFFFPTCKHGGKPGDQLVMTPALNGAGPEFDSRSPHSTHHLCGQHGRAVKALDSKSNGLCPRGFESLCCRAHTYTEREKKNTFCAPIVQWLEFALPKREVRVRFPVGAVKKKKKYFFLSLSVSLKKCCPRGPMDKA